VIYDQVALRSEAGVSNRANVDQIAVRLSLTKSNFIAGKSNFLNALNHFQGLVGYIPDATEMAVPSDFDLPLNLDESIMIALDEYPDIKSKAAEIEVAEAEHAKAKSKHFPKLDFEAGRTWNNNVDGLEGKSENWMIGLRLRYNLYKGGRYNAEGKQAIELLEEAKYALQDAKWKAESGMRQSWYAYETTSQQLSYLEEYVESVSDTKESYIKQFNIGKRSLLDLLNTEAEYIRAKQSYVNIKYDQLFSQARVLNSSGQLIKGLGVWE
jgi:adhesin transport system outer membrane protein